MAPPTYPDTLRALAYQINDYLHAASLTYPKEAPRAQVIVTEVINNTFRLVALRAPTSRTTARARSSKPLLYPVEWAVNRGSFVRDTKALVTDYDIWKRGHTSGTVTPHGKDYSTGATPVHSPQAPSKPARSHFYLVGQINPFMLPTIEGSASGTRLARQATRTVLFSPISLINLPRPLHRLQCLAGRTSVLPSNNGMLFKPSSLVLVHLVLPVLQDLQVLLLL